MNNRALSHIRVLDFGQYVAGPLAGMMLADMGAEVIRIDPPGGPFWKSPATNMLSRGKSSLVLDLKSAEGLRTAKELVVRCDVVIENFRPGVMKRLGLAPEYLLELNPRIVSLSLPGFASTDQELADIPAWEAIIAARTGQFTDAGLNRRLMGICPSFSPLTHASAFGAALGVMAVLFALRAREINGGDHIEVPLASALMEGLAYNSVLIENYPDRYKSPREVELERRTAKGLAMDLRYEELSEFLDPFFRTYRCADGRGFNVVAVSTASHPRRVLETLGLKELVDELPDFDAYLDRLEWPDQWSLRNYPVGERDRSRIAQAMQTAFSKKTSSEWEECFGRAKAPATVHRSTREWLSDPHALASGLILEVNDRRFGKMRQMGNAAWLAEDGYVLEKTGAPQPNKAQPRMREILAEPPPRDTTHRQCKAWLEGLKVLDLTNVIAGPTIGSTLARFGAAVTSVQPVTPSFDPWNTVVFGLQAHRGKESVLLNLRSEDGQQALRSFLSESDVVTFNGTDAQRDNLGLQADRLNDINPRLIFVQLDAFGGPRRGSKSDHLGYDTLAQAATGMTTRFGGGAETPEEHAHFGTIDVLTGYCACVALGAALLRLDETGKGGTARTSLTAAANLFQAPFMYDFEGRAPFNEPSGRNTLGCGPLYRCYKAKDAWMFFAAPFQGRKALRGSPELADLADLPEEELERQLVERFADRNVEQWRKSLSVASASIIALGCLRETCANSLQLESKGEVDIQRATFRTVRHDRHPMQKWVDLVAPNSIRPKRAPIVFPGPMPKYGAATRDALERIRFSVNRIESMIAEGSAAEKWSEKFLPE